jgi:hypothetical protein
MAKDPQDVEFTEPRVTRDVEALPNHCAEIVNPPNRWNINAHVHLCLKLGLEGRGDEVSNARVEIAWWCVPAAVAEELNRNDDTRASLRAEIARAAVTEYMRRDSGVRWAAKLDA